MLKTFCLECADEEMNYHEIVIVAETVDEAVAIAFEMYDGLNHIYNVEVL